MQENSETFYHNLPNGARVVVRRTDSPVVYVGVMVGAGTRDEQPAENGMAHYIEHCVFKGTEKHTARQIINSIEGIGGEINAYTTKEETTFYAATLPEHTTRTLRLLAEMVLRPTFPKHETDKELGVIFDEIESYNDSPSELIYDDFEGMLFDGHPLAMPILGTKKTLRKISTSPICPQRWMRRHYRPERMVVFCQGNIAPDTFFRLAECEFGNIPACQETPAADPRSTRDRPATDPRQGQHIAYKRHTHQVHAMLGNIAYPLGHELQLPFYLLNNIIGGGSLNSRLNLRLRESRGLVYTVESTYTPLSDTGYWCTYFACEPEHFDECLRLCNEELDKLCSHPLSESQIKHALQQLRGQMAIASLNQENNALAMAKSVLYFRHAPIWAETFEQIARTTPAQLRKASEEILTPCHLSILTYE
ncbi:MAG: M16 family metallopeptidase [Paludibacteraceae bacterium]